MEEITWNKDETPYIVFRCSQCLEYTYAKTIQKSKRCPRCGKIHKVEQVLSRGEKVNGISNAVDKVKQKQNKLAIQELGCAPDLRANGDFKIVSTANNRIDNEDFEAGNEYSKIFDKILREISKEYSKFPFYVIEMMAKRHKIPLDELGFLVSKRMRQGSLTKSEDSFFHFNPYFLEKD